MDEEGEKVVIRATLGIRNIEKAKNGIKEASEEVPKSMSCKRQEPLKAARLRY